jgi:phosphoglycolate phosphatase-like HAD superfamily hydrolase
MPWARRALRDLRRQGVKVGLVTASTRAVVEPNIERLNLAGVFQTAWYSDDVERSKPHPEALVRALDDLGVAAADTVYVGDTLVDLEMTVAAGASFVAVGTTMAPGAFREAGVERVWPGVGAWVDDLLGLPSPRSGTVPERSGPHGPRTGPTGTAAVPERPVRSRP